MSIFVLITLIIRMARDKAANLSRLVIDTGTPLSAAGHRLEPTRPLGTLKEIQLHERQHGGAARAVHARRSKPSRRRT